MDASLRWRDGGKLGGTAPTSAAATAFSCNSASCAQFFVNQNFEFLHVFFYRINLAVDLINLPIIDIKFLQPLSKPDFSIFR